MKTKIFHSVNCGLYLHFEETALLVDGIHEGRKVGMSLMPPQILGEMENGGGIFRHLDGILFTHLHDDHFSMEKVCRLFQKIPGLSVYGPFLEESNVTITVQETKVKEFTIGGARILAAETLHDGEIYRNTPHESFVIAMGNENFFIAGDALLFREEADVFLKYSDHIDAAFVNLYQLANDTGIEFLRRMAPKRILLYHLPFEQDDTFNYLRMARQVVRRLSARGICVEVLKHMSWFDEKPVSRSKIIKNCNC